MSITSTTLPNPDEKSYVQAVLTEGEWYNFDIPMIYRSHLRIGHRPTGVFPADPGIAWATGTLQDMIDSGRIEVTEENGTTHYKPWFTTGFIFYRETPATPLASFRSASGLSERDLEIAYRQAAFIAQEAREARERGGLLAIADDFLKTAEFSFSDYNEVSGAYVKAGTLPNTKEESLVWVGGKQIARDAYDLGVNGGIGSLIILDSGLATAIVENSWDALVLDLGNWIRTSIDIEEGSIERVMLEEAIIDSSKLEDASVTEDKLADASVSTDKIQDESITPEKIQPGVTLPITINTDGTLEGAGSVAEPLRVNKEELDVVGISDYDAWVNTPPLTEGWLRPLGTITQTEENGPFHIVPPGGSSAQNPHVLVTVPTLIFIEARNRTGNLGNWTMTVGCNRHGETPFIQTQQYSAAQSSAVSVFFIPPGWSFRGQIAPNCSSLQAQFRLVPLALTDRSE